MAGLQLVQCPDGFPAPVGGDSRLDGHTSFRICDSLNNGRLRLRSSIGLAAEGDDVA
jgi:hypothetical protein